MAVCIENVLLKGNRLCKTYDVVWGQEEEHQSECPVAFVGQGKDSGCISQHGEKTP